MQLRRLLTLPLLMLCLYAAAETSPGWAEEKKAEKPGTVDTKAIDTVAYKALRSVINQGADLYNGGNFLGCYALYEDTLTSFKPLLAHRPNLQKAIDDALAQAKTSKVEDKAFVLRAVIDQIRKEVGPATVPVVVPVVPIAKTLWDKLGGDKGVTKVVNDFLPAAMKDPKVNFDRDGKFKLDAAGVDHAKKTLVEFISSVTEGPLKYTGKTMKAAHKGMGITDEEFDAAGGHLSAALKKNNVNAEDANALLERIGKLRTDIVEGKKIAPPTPVTLWDRLGGEKGVGKVVDDFVAAAAPDPKVDFSRGGKYKVDAAKLKKALVEQISSVSGGPLKYTGKSMAEVHKGMEITNEQFDALAGHLVAALKKNGVKEEDAKLVMAVVNGTRTSIVEGKKPEPPKPVTLWDNLGGEKGVAKIVNDFFTSAAKDPKVNLDRGGKRKLDAEAVAAAEKKLVEFYSSLTGGPLKYTGKSMKEAHKGVGVTNEEFDAALVHLTAALKKNSIKDEDAKAFLALNEKQRADVVEAKAPPVEPTVKSLWDRLGGEAGVGKVMDEFIMAALADPKVNFYRDADYKPTKDQIAGLKKKLVELVSSFSGGPLKYTGKTMKTAHASMKITDAEFDACAKHLETVLKANKVKDDDIKSVMGVVAAQKKDIVEKNP